MFVQNSGKTTISCAYALLLLILSLVPVASDSPAVSWLGHFDKLIHALMYVGMSALLVWTFQPWWHKSPWRPLSAIILVAAGYGALLELLQEALSCFGRSGSWLDALANLIGAILGTILTHYHFKRRPQ